LVESKVDARVSKLSVNALLKLRAAILIKMQ